MNCYFTSDLKKVNKICHFEILEPRFQPRTNILCPTLKCGFQVWVPMRDFCYNSMRYSFERMMMTIAKQSAKKVIDSLPDDTSYDEIIKELAFHRMIERGLEDSKNGRTISNEEMKQKIKQWRRY